MKIKKFHGKINLIIYLLLLSGGLVFFSTCSGYLPYLTVYFLLMLPVSCYLYIAYCFYHITIDQEVSSLTITKGKAISYSLKAGNTGHLSLLHVQLNLFEGITNSEDNSMEGFETIFPKKTIEKKANMTFKYSGSYEIGIKNLVVFDYFKIFSKKNSLPQPIRLTVNPRLLLLPELTSILFGYTKDQKHPSISMMEHQVGFEVREYVPGDCPRLIHWNNSAKAGKLMVRKEEPSLQNMFLVCMDTGFSDEHNNSLTARKKYIDKYLELTLGTVHTLLSYSIPVILPDYFGNDIYHMLFYMHDLKQHYGNLATFSFSEKNNVFELIKKQLVVLSEHGQSDLPTQAIAITDYFSFQDKKTLALINEIVSYDVSLTIFYIYEQNENSIPETVPIERVSLLMIPVDCDLVSYFKNNKTI